MKHNIALRRALVAISIAALFTLPGIIGLPAVTLTVYQPPERALWERLHLRHDAAYFESGNAPIHQLYADMPQVVDWEDGTDWVRLVEVGK